MRLIKKHVWDFIMGYIHNEIQQNQFISMVFEFLNCLYFVSKGWMRLIIKFGCDNFMAYICIKFWPKCFRNTDFMWITNFKIPAILKENGWWGWSIIMFDFIMGYQGQTRSNAVAIDRVWSYGYLHNKFQTNRFNRTIFILILNF